MTVDVNNVLVATGIVLVAPTSTSLPTDPTTTPDGAFNDLGGVKEDGLTQAISEDNTTIKLWDGSTARKIVTSFDLTFALGFLETNPDVLEFYYGNYTDETNFGSIEIKKALGVRHAIIFDMVDGDNLVRIVVPNGEITTRGDTIYKNDDAVAYNVTITAYQDDAGVSAYEYVKTPSAS